MLSGLVVGAIGLEALLAPLRATEAASNATYREEASDVVYPQLIADAYVSSVAYTTNFGNATYLDVQNYDGQEFPDDRRSYVDFDLSKIPSDAVITSAAFKAYLYDCRVSEPLTSTCGGSPRPEREKAVIWNNKPSSSTYIKMLVDNTTGTKGWDVTNLVQVYWVNSDFVQSPNFGLELRGPESGDYYLRRFYSSKHRRLVHAVLVAYAPDDQGSHTHASSMSGTRGPKSNLVVLRRTHSSML